MKISHCMSKDVQLCSPSETIQHAAQMMKAIDAGAIPVGENDRLVGMVTDRDIALRAVAEGRGPETAVRDAMSPDICYCFDDEELEAVAQQMRDLKVRRMPVLNRDKRLVGIVSLGDISQSDQREAGEALQEISTPGGQHSH